MDCRNALLNVNGDMEKALQCLKEQGFLKAKKKADRTASQGLVEAYIHSGGRIGVIVELGCETDFVARTTEFKELAHNLALQIAALSPQYISSIDIPEGTDLDPKEVCLTLQSYIKAPEMTIQDVITEVIAKVGENIKIKRFSRFEIGE
jgi:elongation factor Ts